MTSDVALNPTQNETPTYHLDWLELLVVLARSRRIIVGATVACAVLGTIIALVIPKSYTATAKILPPSPSAQSTATAALGQLGLGAISGKELGLKNPNDLYVGMLRSRSVADALIERFHLKDVYRIANPVDARHALELHSAVVSEKEGLISIAVTEHDPSRAAAIANGYVEELVRLTQRLALSEASQRRLFFEKQLQLAKTDLANAEVALRSTQERTGLIEPEEQARAIVGSAAELKARIAAAEIRLQSMKSFATENNPDVVRAREELSGMRAQMAQLERRPVSGDGDIQVATGKIPAAAMEYTRKLRDLKYEETLFELLSRQYETARIDEAKSAVLIQVVDSAVPPEKKSAPHRSLIVLLSLLAGAIASSVWVLLREAYLRMRNSPEHGGKLQSLETYLVTWR